MESKSKNNFDDNYDFKKQKQLLEDYKKHCEDRAKRVKEIMEKDVVTGIFQNPNPGRKNGI